MMRRHDPNNLERMKVLPLRLRVAHLTALIRQEGSGSTRAEQLAMVLRGQLTVLADNENRAI